MAELSPQETQLMISAASGLTDDAIAKKLGISVATVRGYWQRIRSKLSGASRSELVAQWIQKNSDAETLRIASEHADTIAAMQAEFEAKLEHERAAMEKIYGKTTAKQSAQIAEYRKVNDEDPLSDPTASEKLASD